MYRIIVADDEEELRKAIIRKINWEDIGFTVVGEADNGIDALELVENLEPDLLLTDIRMPYISGIELARQVREVRPATQIAFLSGFDDFSYAQQAIQYNIISYLLKPISMAELTDELTKIKKKIDGLFQEFRSQSRMHTDMAGFLVPLLLDDFQSESVSKSEEQLRMQAVECGMLKENQAPFAYVVMLTSLFGIDDANRTSLVQTNAVDSILKKYVKYYSFYSKGKIISFLLAPPAAMDKYLHIIVEEITQSMERILELHCIIGLSRLTRQLSSCHEAYREAVHAMSYAERSSSSVHYITDEERSGSWDMETIQHEVAEMENRVRAGSSSELEQYLKKFFAKLAKENASRSRINFMLTQLLTAVYRLACVAGGEEVQSRQDISFVQGITSMEGSLSEAERWFREYCLNVKEIISRQKKRSSELLCEQTLKMIEKNFADPGLCLIKLSSAVNVSPNYLSTLIKKDTGKTFVDLLTQRRMEKAKEFLLCSAIKIREISEKCGYNDQHYFSYCFKKFWGTSPNAMRQQNDNGDMA